MPRRSYWCRLRAVAVVRRRPRHRPQLRRRLRPFLRPLLRPLRAPPTDNGGADTAGRGYGAACRHQRAGRAMATGHRADGETQLVAVYRPSGTGPHPVVVLFHGSSGLATVQLAWASILAQKGFIVVAAATSTPPRARRPACSFRVPGSPTTRRPRSRASARRTRRSSMSPRGSMVSKPARWRWSACHSAPSWCSPATTPGQGDRRRLRISPNARHDEGARTPARIHERPEGRPQQAGGIRAHAAGRQPHHRALLLRRKPRRAHHAEHDQRCDRPHRRLPAKPPRLISSAPFSPLRSSQSLHTLCWQHHRELHLHRQPNPRAARLIATALVLLTFAADIRRRTHRERARGWVSSKGAVFRSEGDCRPDPSGEPLSPKADRGPPRRTPRQPSRRRRRGGTPACRVERRLDAPTGRSGPIHPLRETQKPETTARNDAPTPVHTRAFGTTRPRRRRRRHEERE